MRLRAMQYLRRAIGFGRWAFGCLCTASVGAAYAGMLVSSQISQRSGDDWGKRGDMSLTPRGRERRRLKGWDMLGFKTVANTAQTIQVAVDCDRGLSEAVAPRAFELINEWIDSRMPDSRNDPRARVPEEILMRCIGVASSELAAMANQTILRAREPQPAQRDYHLEDATMYIRRSADISSAIRIAEMEDDVWAEASTEIDAANRRPADYRSPLERTDVEPSLESSLFRNHVHELIHSRRRDPTEFTSLPYAIVHRQDNPIAQIVSVPSIMRTGTSVVNGMLVAEAEGTMEFYDPTAIARAEQEGMRRMIEEEDAKFMAAVADATREDSSSASLRKLHRRRVRVVQQDGQTGE